DHGSVLPDQSRVAGGPAKPFRQPLRQCRQLVGNGLDRRPGSHPPDQWGAEVPDLNLGGLDLARDPQQGTVAGEPEFGTHDPDYRAALPGDRVTLPNHRGIATEPGPPQRV